MSDIAIRAEGLGKRYRIGGKQEWYKTLRGSLADAASRPFRAARSLIGGKANHDGRYETIWALKDVSFEVRRGEVVGIIGRNGAGKSTLLKILGRITDPTEGFAEVHGRVGSLLEVGTGFHPELTGRENIYLNGAILGMRRAEIGRKFDEIVAFAGLERFIDTAVKYYSSGMYMRLAFSVAAHLEPEILLVDEVLAVGDAAFQKKCLGKMGEVARQGRTVLFVSHNLGQMRTLCEYAMWLNSGKVAARGAFTTVAVAYERDLTKPPADQPLEKGNRSGGFLAWRLVTNSPDAKRVVLDGEPLAVEFTFHLPEAVFHADVAILIQSPDGQTLGGWNFGGVRLKQGTYKLVCNFSQLPLRPGIYFWHASIWDGARKVDVTRLLPDLAIATPDYSGLPPERAGVMNIACQSHIEPVQETVIVREDASE